MSMSLRLIHPLVQHLRNVGFDVSVLVRELDLDIASVYDPDARISDERLLEIWQRAELLTKDPCIALRAACTPRYHLLRYARTEMQYLLVHLLASSPTIGEGLRHFARNFALLHIGARLEIVPGRRQSLVRYVVPGEPGRWRLPVEFQVSMLARLVMGLAEAVPTEVRFAHGPPAAVVEYSNAFGGAVRFSAEDSGFVLSDAALAQVPPTANAELALALSRRAADALDALAPAPSLSSQVRAELIEALQRGCPTVERVGKALGMSVRTLSRRLRHEGTSYQALLDEVRAERAQHYLEVARLPAAEVGARLGFSETSAFLRAFKRWHGRPLSQLRPPAGAVPEPKDPADE